MKMKVEWKVQVEARYVVRSVVCSSLSMGAVGDVRSTLGHDEGSARKLAGMGCSEPWRVHKDRSSLSAIFSVPRE